MINDRIERYVLNFKYNLFKVRITLISQISCFPYLSDIQVLVRIIARDCQKQTSKIIIFESL